MFNIFKLLSVPFGFIMRWCYKIIPNYGAALILFAIITKILMIPFSIKQQKNSIKTLINQKKMQPKLEKLKIKYGKNKELYNSEMMKLYQEEGINPLGNASSGCLLPVIELVIMLGLFGVVYAPASYILKIPAETINAGVKITQDLQSLGPKTRYMELIFISALKQNSGAFSSLGQETVNSIVNFNTTLFGIDFATVPKLGFNVMMILPILAILIQILSIFQVNKHNVMVTNDPAQEKMMKIMQFAPTILLSYIYFSMPSGIAFYFIVSGVLSMLQTEVLYKFYDPKKALAEFEQQQQEERKRQREEKLELKQQFKNGAEISEEEKKKIVSKSEYNRQKINEARRKIEEKYGEKPTED